MFLTGLAIFLALLLVVVKLPRRTLLRLLRYDLAIVCAAVTRRIVDALEAGTTPWRCPWRGADARPANADHRLEQGSWLDYGTFLQNVMIAARAHAGEPPRHRARARRWLRALSRRRARGAAASGVRCGCRPDLGLMPLG